MTPQQKWRKANPEKIRAIKKRWRKNNKERVRKHHSDYYTKNKPAKIQYAKDWARKHPRKLLSAQLRRSYGISIEQYDMMVVAQEGRCDICLRPMSGPKEPCVDHDHLTNAVRGLLCSNCNKVLGFMNDRPDLLLRARDYLLRHRIGFSAYAEVAP